MSTVAAVPFGKMPLRRSRRLQGLSPISIEDREETKRSRSPVPLCLEILPVPLKRPRLRPVPTRGILGRRSRTRPHGVVFTEVVDTILIDVVNSHAKWRPNMPRLTADVYTWGEELDELLIEMLYNNRDLFINCRFCLFGFGYSYSLMNAMMDCLSITSRRGLNMDGSTHLLLGPSIQGLSVDHGLKLIRRRVQNTSIPKLEQVALKQNSVSLCWLLSCLAQAYKIPPFIGPPISNDENVRSKL